MGTEKLKAHGAAGQAVLLRRPRYAARARELPELCSCHNDGGHDGRVWDFTGLGEGLRNTIALAGRAGAQGFQHWSGNFDEVQDFEGQIRSLAGGTGSMTDAAFNQGTRSQPLGDEKAGVSTDLDALAAYVGSLNVSRQPVSQCRRLPHVRGGAGHDGFRAARVRPAVRGANFTDSGAARCGT